MQTSTYLMLFTAFILFIAGPARAQDLPELPDISQLPEFPFPAVQADTCSIETSCFTASFEEFAINADSTTYTILMNIIPLNGDSCANTQQIAVTALGSKQTQTFTLAELEDNPNVVLEVNIENFHSFPQVGIVGLGPLVVNGQQVLDRYPYQIVALNARLGTDAPCQPIVPLPVELISFKGKATAAGIALEWSTASEKDNSHFEVERSTDGQAFEQIGKVNGNGNSSVKRTYHFTDSNPALDLNYYRLKQVDFDGKSAYSKVITVTADALANSELSITLAPNPCLNGDCAAVISNPGQSQAIRLQLKDMSGRVILTRTVSEASGRTLKIPMDELVTHKGLFILTATSGNNVVHKRVVLR